MDATRSANVWPLFDLVVTTPRLRLRYATDHDLQTLARFRRRGVVTSDGEEPFDGDSTFYMEAPEAESRALTGEWGARARTSAEWWHLSFAVLIDDEVVGQQNITGIDFRRRRTVTSFSFLARTHQGQGVGQEMRSAVLHLAFAGLGALRAESDAFSDNPASLGVSRALGYRQTGQCSRPGPAAPTPCFASSSRERFGRQGAGTTWRSKASNPVCRSSVSRAAQRTPLRRSPMPGLYG